MEVVAAWHLASAPHQTTSFPNSEESHPLRVLFEKCMKNLIAVFLCCFFSIQVQAKDPFRLKLKLRSDSLPSSYKILVKLSIVFEVVDIEAVLRAKKFAPAESDVVFQDKNPKEVQFTVTYPSGKPVFSVGNTVELVIPGGIADAPKGLMADLNFPCEFEIYDGPRLLRKSKPKFKMLIETARSKEICFRISNRGELPSGQGLNIGVSVASCDLDFSKIKRVPNLTP